MHPERTGRQTATLPSAATSTTSDSSWRLNHVAALTQAVRPRGQLRQAVTLPVR
jgi:hypothetical protein